MRNVAPVLARARLVVATIAACSGVVGASGCPSPTVPTAHSEHPTSLDQGRPSPLSVLLAQLPHAWWLGKPRVDIAPKPTDTGNDDLTAQAFDKTHVIDIALTMSADDFAELRAQRRTLVELEKPGCGQAPFQSPFTKFAAHATIDGVDFGAITVKKRGFLGSVSTQKPALKIALGTHHYYGEDSFTLANEIQDESMVHTCLAYEIFGAAGVPSPRCNFAHVVVNGEDLGVYAHVEAPGHKMLAHNFTDATGNLYEGTYSDFATGWDKTFSKDTNSASTAAPEVAHVEQAIAGGASALAGAIDVDEFNSFWAVEALIGDWDAYTNGQNNFYIYGNPANGKVSFIPWGPDQTMVAQNYTAFQSVYANGIVARTLYFDPSSQQAFFTRMNQILDNVWTPAVLDAEVDRMNALIAPYLLSSQQPYQAQAIGDVKAFIDGRRAVIQAELANGPPAWNEAFPELVCMTQNGSIDATFQTSFGGTTGSATLHGTLNGSALPTSPTPSSTTATADFDANDHGAVVVEIDASAGGKSYVAQVSTRARAFSPGSVALDDEHAVFALYERVNGALQFRGRAYGGTLTLTSASTTSGAVAGSLHADLINLETDMESQ